MNAQRNLTTSKASLAISMQRLSSGLRVNSAKDDAAGLAIADRMNAQIRGINVAIRNANDGISLAQTAEGALATVTDVLQRMRELAVQAQNGTNGTGDRANLNTEYQQLSAEVTRIAAQTKFNGMAIVGAGAGATVFQVGANNGDTLTITTAAVTTVAGDLTTAANASTAVAALDTAMDTITTSRATYGAAMSRFQFAISNLQITGENQSAARGRIMDADFASETANLSRAQILQQAGSAMVAQANQLPQPGAGAAALIGHRRRGSRRRRVSKPGRPPGWPFSFGTARHRTGRLGRRISPRCRDAATCRRTPSRQAAPPRGLTRWAIARRNWNPARSAHAPDHQHQRLVAERAAQPGHVEGVRWPSRCSACRRACASIRRRTTRPAWPSPTA